MQKETPSTLKSTRVPRTRSEAISAQAGSHVMPAQAGSHFMHSVQDLVADRRLRVPRWPAQDRTMRLQQLRPQPISTADSDGEDFYGGCPFQHEADALADEDEIVGGGHPEADDRGGPPGSPSLGGPTTGDGTHPWLAAGSGGPSGPVRFASAATGKASSIPNAVSSCVKRSHTPTTKARRAAERQAEAEQRRIRRAEAVAYPAAGSGGSCSAAAERQTASALHNGSPGSGRPSQGGSSLHRPAVCSRPGRDVSSPRASSEGQASDDKNEDARQGAEPGRIELDPSCDQPPVASGRAGHPWASAGPGGPSESVRFALAATSGHWQSLGYSERRQQPRQTQLHADDES